MDPPAYILSLQNSIRARPISWEGAVRAKTITEQDLKKIKSVDKVRREQRKHTVENDPEAYSTLLLGGRSSTSILQAAAKRTDIVQFILVLTGDLIDDIPSFVQNLLDHENPFANFLPLLKQADPIPLLTSSVLSSLLSHAIVATPKHSSAIDDALSHLFSYIASLSQNNDAGLQDIAVQQYSAILQSRKARHQFWDQRQRTLKPLVEILQQAVRGSELNADTATLRSAMGSIRTNADSIVGGGVGLQLLYHVLLVIWQLSFEGQLVGKGLDDEYDIITLYISLIRISPKEKTTRLLLSTLHNLLAANLQTLMPAAIPAKLPEVLKNLAGRQLTDDDLKEDLDALLRMVDEYTKTQTTFDEYDAEVRSGHLHWSPPHRDQDFWRENAGRILDEDKGELPKLLAAILAKDWASDKQVLAVGCNDVGWLVKQVPEKRQVLERLGLKARLMELMQSSDESVRWESLRAVGEWLRYSMT